MRARRSRRVRALGQNFLTNLAAADQIVRAFAPLRGEVVVEVGPGRGVLTSRLLAAGARVLAVEADRDLAEALRRDLGPGLVVVAGDAREADLGALLAGLEDGAAPCRVLANLPYSVGTEILVKLLLDAPHLRSLTVMLQREVAERVAARPGGRLYGSLSVVAQYFTEPRIVMRLAPGSFTPAPKVHSALLTMPFRAARELPPRSERDYLAFVRRLFHMRRRTLPHNLEPVWAVDRAEAARRLREMGIDPVRRPETLDRQECLRLFAASPPA